MAETYNFPNHKKNDTFVAQEFTYTRNGSPINLTGATIAMMLRLVKSADPVALSLSTATSGKVNKTSPKIILNNFLIINSSIYSYTFLL